MIELTKDMLLGTAIQLIKDIERLSFLGERRECIKIQHMTREWLKQFDGIDNGDNGS